MAVTTTPRLGLTRWSAGSDPFTRAQMDAAMAALEAGAAMFAPDAPVANRPAPGKQGRFFRASDTGLFYYDTGSAWMQVAPDLSGYATTQALADGLATKANTGHTHAAGDVTSGVFAPARLGTGGADSTKVLYGDGTWKAAAAGSVSGLSDVAVTALVGGQVLRWDATASRWKNVTLATADVSGLDTALGGKAATNHSHTKSQITDFAHTHPIADLPVAASGTSSSTQLVRADDSRLNNPRTPTGAASGHLTGTYPSPSVIALGFTDTRTVATTPDDYNTLGRWQFKQTDVMGLPGGTSTTYAFVFGFRMYSDSTGGDAWEYAHTMGGDVYRRRGATLAWGAWQQVEKAGQATVFADDARLSDTRTPKAHSHAIGDLPVAGAGVSSSTQLVRADDPRLADPRTPTAHTHPTSAITGLDAALAKKLDESVYKRLLDPEAAYAAGDVVVNPFDGKLYKAKQAAPANGHTAVSDVPSNVGVWVNQDVASTDGRNSVPIAIPAGAVKAGDLLLAAHSGESSTSAMPTGGGAAWTRVGWYGLGSGGNVPTSASNYTLHFYQRRATAADEAGFTTTFTDASSTIAGWSAGIRAYRGVDNIAFSTPEWLRVAGNAVGQWPTTRVGITKPATKHLEVVMGVFRALYGTPVKHTASGEWTTAAAQNRTPNPLPNPATLTSGEWVAGWDRVTTSTSWITGGVSAVNSADATTNHDMFSMGAVLSAAGAIWTLDPAYWGEADVSPFFDDALEAVGPVAFTWADGQITAVQTAGESVAFTYANGVLQMLAETKGGKTTTSEIIYDDAWQPVSITPRRVT